MPPRGVKSVFQWADRWQNETREEKCGDDLTGLSRFENSLRDWLPSGRSKTLESRREICQQERIGLATWVEGVTEIESKSVSCDSEDRGRALLRSPGVGCF